ncbi:MAG: response regulator [Elainellaceae cyanobacterium]
MLEDDFARPQHILTQTIQTPKADILVVDDVPENVRFLSEMLTQNGFSVRKAISGKMALAAVHNLLPDLILLDVKMPDLDGYEVCAKIKSDPNTAAVPVIFLSAWSDTATKLKAFQAGGVDYITKPFHFEEVIARIETQLKLTQLQSQLKEQNEELQGTLSRLQETQSRLVQQEKMASLGRFVAGVAHEINNPIGFIACNIEPMRQYIQQMSHLLKLYQSEQSTPSEMIEAYKAEIDYDFVNQDVEDILVSIEHGTTRVQSIVLALKIFSRLGETDIKPVDIHQGMDSCLMLLNHRLHAIANTKIEGDRPVPHPILVIKEYDHVPHVTCHASHINQAIFSIIDNAINALRDKERTASDSDWQPTLWVETHLSTPDTVQICIRDNGSGIPKTLLPRLFDPFFKGNNRAQSPGLGLHTAYQIVTNQHHGTIRCSSTHGKETEFVIEVPIEWQAKPLPKAS